ncbi:MAG: hypothetical protein KDH09_15190, partial [Chrysiogenetes bacterium]|nr:hypothetical protein [Chrysiogenetes bacterium]
MSNWEKFRNLAYQRMSEGREEYGHSAVTKSFDQLDDEIEQEILDQWAWAEQALLKMAATGERGHHLSRYKAIQQAAFEQWER